MKMVQGGKDSNIRHPGQHSKELQIKYLKHEVMRRMQYWISPDPKCRTVQKNKGFVVEPLHTGKFHIIRQMKACTYSRDRNFFS
jgi:hypothetical protein